MAIRGLAFVTMTKDRLMAEGKILDLRATEEEQAAGFEVRTIAPVVRPWDSRNNDSRAPKVRY
jgi:hypothetical protein